MKCPVCGAGLELALTAAAAGAVPVPAAPPPEPDGQRRRHTPEEWAAARRWCEEEGLTDAEISSRLGGVTESTVRQRRYSEHWRPRVGLDGKLIRPVVPDTMPQAAERRASVPAVVAAPVRVRAIPPTRHKSCGKWTTKDPCWNCHEPVGEV